ncbi:tryptophanyl-tRNA synthetase [Pisolithus sp. B1]|nr:tryptophanyl-tRNA synthetase [Pisolithus sp. B1]
MTIGNGGACNVSGKYVRLRNYHGTLSNRAKLQKSAEPDDTLLFSIVGWYGLTLPQDPTTLRSAREDMLALLAIGLDPERSILFHQDHNLYHVELCWVLNCLAPVGKLRRMTTWKSRLATSRNAGPEDEMDESLPNSGLFTYPVLQAADVLVYRATHVPVGEDQQQHIELTRDPGQNPLFPLPMYVNAPSKRILSLRDPISKMSKSSPDAASRILIDRYHIRAAVTDSIPGISYDPVHRPGTSNLLTILAACTEGDVEDVARVYASRGHGQLKSDVADAVEELLKGPRSEPERIRHEKAYLHEIARKGACKAMVHSGATMEDVRQRIGLA